MESNFFKNHHTTLCCLNSFYDPSEGNKYDLRRRPDNKKRHLGSNKFVVCNRPGNCSPYQRLNTKRSCVSRATEMLLDSFCVIKDGKWLWQTNNQQFNAVFLIIQYISQLLD